MVVLLMNLKMLVQIVYPVSQYSNLNLRRTGVSFLSLVLFDDFRFLFSSYRFIPPYDDTPAAEPSSEFRPTKPQVKS